MILEQSSWGLKTEKIYPKLNENIETDVVIIGAGLAGIFNAYILSKVGIKVVVLEKNEKILQSTTMFTTAFITKVIDTSFNELVELFGKNKAEQVWKSGQSAIELIADIIKKENIDCEFKFVSAYHYAGDEKQFEELTKECLAIKKSKIETSLEKDGSKLNFKNSGFLEIPNQAIFHPLKFARGLVEAAESAGAKIFTSSEVLTIEKSVVKTKTGGVFAKDILIATYEPITDEGTHFKKAMYVSYVYDLEIAKGLIGEGMYFDMNNPYHYFRIDQFENFDRMIVGGEDHRKELKINPDKNFYALERYIKSVLGENNYKITRKWSGQILETIDGLPLVGKIKQHTFVISGFSGNGMTYSAISSQIICDLVLGRINTYTDLYDPKRKTSLKQLLKKGTDYVGEFFGGALKNFFSNEKNVNKLLVTMHVRK